MAARRRGRKGGGRFTTILTVLIALGLIGFVVWTVIEGMVQKTDVIRSGSMGNLYTAEGVVVRNEKVTDTEALTKVKYYAEEGEILYPGSRIVDVYTSGLNQTDLNKLLNTRTEIKRHVTTALASNYMDNQLDRLDASVLEYARELGLLVQSKAQGNLLNLERQLTSALASRQNHLREKYYSTDAALAALYDTETSLVKKIQTWTTPHLATQNCIVSFYMDDYETMLDFANADSITPGQVKSVLAGDRPQMSTAQRGRTALFREVVPTGYYLMLISNDKNWSPVDGQRYQVMLSGFEGLSIEGTVSSSTRNGNELLVRVYVDADVRPLLNERRVRAQVSETYITGLQVPATAIYRQNGESGVVLTDSGGVFVPVNILTQDNSFAVITPTIPGTLAEGQRIRIFD